MDNHLKFTIEESVWFQRGEEIDDILAVSLEPEITVVEEGEYVFIKGSLRLDGEFRMLEEESESGKQDHLSEQLSFRAVQEVRASNDGTAEFQHHFPVEITIPMERVEQVDDIYVVVNSFDYQLPNEQCFQLSAELAISGIKENMVRVEEGINAVETIVQKDLDEMNENTPFEIEVKQAVETEQTEALNLERNLEETEEEKQSEVIELEKRTEAVEEKVNTELDEVQEETEQEEGSSTIDDEKEQIPQIELKSREEDREYKQPDNEREGLISSMISSKAEEIEVEDKVEDEEENERVEMAELEEETVGEEPEEKEPRNENALYLTKMLTRDGEEFSKLRMRIIQPGDSLRSIAERYELQPSQLLRINKLEHEEVEEGQILYIPVNAGKKLG